MVRLEGLSINGTGAANTVGIEFKGTYGGSSDGAIEVVGTSVSNFGRVGLLINGGGSGLSVSVGDDASTLAAETATFSGSGGANPLDNGTGDILFFEFTGDALLRNVAVTGNSASADNGIQISGFQDGVGSANNVLTEIGNVRLENVSVNGTYQKTLVYIQGYNDLTALDFANVNLGALTGTAAGWAALFIDGAPQGGAYAANGTAGGSIDGTLDLTGVTVIGGIFGTTPNFVALGSKQIVVNGTLTDDSIVGTSAHEAFIGLAGNDVIATGGGNDLVLYNVGDGQDTVTDNGGFDTLGLINVDATLAPSATAASWTITNTGTTLSVDTDAAGTIDEVAATGFEALAVQLGDGGDTVTLDGNLGAGGAGLFAITVNGGLAGADGADIVDARTLSSATGIVFNGGAGSDRFVSSNAGGTDTFNGGADGVTGDTVDYSAVTGSGVTVNLSASGVNSTGAGNDTLINVENVIGTNQADTFTGSSDNNMFDGRGGAAVDQVNGYTGPGWQIRINAAGHWVVQNASGDVDELIDIEKVVINGTTYLLVDQQSRRRLRLGPGGDRRGERRRGHPDRAGQLCRKQGPGAALAVRRRPVHRQAEPHPAGRAGRRHADRHRGRCARFRRHHRVRRADRLRCEPPGRGERRDDPGPAPEGRRRDRQQAAGNLGRRLPGPEQLRRHHPGGRRRDDGGDHLHQRGGGHPNRQLPHRRQHPQQGDLRRERHRRCSGHDRHDADHPRQHLHGRRQL